MCCRYFHSALFFIAPPSHDKDEEEDLACKGGISVNKFPILSFGSAFFPLSYSGTVHIWSRQFVPKSVTANLFWQRSRGISPKCPALPEISVCWTSCVKKVFLRYWCSSSCAFFSAFWTCAYILNTHTQNAGKMYGWGSDNLRSSKSLFENQRSSFVGALWFIFTKNFWNDASLRYLDVLVHKTDTFVFIF